MPVYSQQSEGRLSTCHSDLQKVFRRVLEVFDHTIECGFRNKDAQDNAVLTGHSQTPWPTSKHNKIPSEAVDAMPWPYSYADLEGKNGKGVQLRALVRCGMFIGYVIATADEMYAKGEIEAPITTGVDWDNDKNVIEERFLDLPHYQRRMPYKSDERKVIQT